MKLIYIFFTMSLICANGLLFLSVERYYHGRYFDESANKEFFYSSTMACEMGVYRRDYAVSISRDDNLSIFFMIKPVGNWSYFGGNADPRPVVDGWTAV